MKFIASVPMATNTKGSFSPPYRWELRKTIEKAGYKSIKEFNNDMHYSISYCYRLLNGWVYPSHEWQGRAVRVLGITFKELRELL
jgi:hypothetical protein